MKCNSCNDKFRCDFYMHDYPGSGSLWKSKKLCEEREDKNRYKWTLCSERLPKEKGDYLVTCDDGTVCIWWFVIEGDLKVWQTRLCDCKPIAWMPLPEPYDKSE